jgi:hypothetical protein
VAARSALTARCGYADGEVARVLFLVLDEGVGRERENVCRLIEGAELAVQAANGCISREQHGDAATETDCGLGTSEKEGKGAH